MDVARWVRLEVRRHSWGSSVPHPALVFDGDCAFCSRSAALARRILPADCAVVPWQQVDLATAGITAERARTEVLWIDRAGAVTGGAAAVARALRAAGGFLALIGLLLSLPPIRWAAPPVYRLVAANRYRLPGGTPACRVPTVPPPAA
jgi:predicted DCC family thiol-disulfide oxidoreductase YuxK